MLPVEVRTGNPAFGSPAAPLAVGAMALAGAVVLGVGNPNTTHIPLCPLKAVTGLDCPLCGSLRAVHSLTHLDLVGALSNNLLFTVAAPFLVLGWVHWLRTSLTGGGRRIDVRRGVLITGIVVVLVFTVARNLPVGGWLGSGA